MHEFVPSEVQSQPTEYDLVSVICHSAASNSGGLNDGKFYTIGKRSRNEWYLFNEDPLKELEMNEVVDSSAYILIYEQRKK